MRRAPRCRISESWSIKRWQPQGRRVLWTKRWQWCSVRYTWSSMMQGSRQGVSEQSGWSRFKICLPTSLFSVNDWSKGWPRQPFWHFPPGIFSVGPYKLSKVTIAELVPLRENGVPFRAPNKGREYDRRVSSGFIHILFYFLEKFVNFEVDLWSWYLQKQLAQGTCRQKSSIGFGQRAGSSQCLLQTGISVVPYGMASLCLCSWSAIGQSRTSKRISLVEWLWQTVFDLRSPKEPFSTDNSVSQHFFSEVRETRTLDWQKCAGNVFMPSFDNFI